MKVQAHIAKLETDPVEIDRVVALSVILLSLVVVVLISMRSGILS